MKSLGVAILYATIVGLFIFAMFSGIARADDLPDPPTTALEIGEPAPFSGLLLSELRFTELKTAEFSVDDLRLKLEASERAYTDTRVVADSCLADLDQAGGPAWYASVEFWAGTAVGVGTAILVGWLGSEAEWW